MRKLIGAPCVLEQALSQVRSKIDCAFVFGSVAKGTEQPESDVDLMVIGSASLTDLLPALRHAEQALGRPVNPTIYPPTELAEKFRTGHHFVQSVMSDPAKIFVVGSADDLEAITNGPTNQTSSDKQIRTRRPCTSHDLPHH